MLSIRELSVITNKDEALIKDVSFDLHRKELIFLTGKSGCGKSTILKAIMGSLDDNLKVYSSKFQVDDIDVNKLNNRRKRRLYGKNIGLIPQNPMNVFDPRKSIRSQILESYKVSLDINKKQSLILAKDMLSSVNLKEVNIILDSLPHELSGGMLQRVIIAILLGIKPDYILADEPVSALDEDNKNEIIKLLLSLKTQSGLLITTHNTKFLSSNNDKTLKMKNGKIIKEEKRNNLKPVYSDINSIDDNYCNEGDFKWTVYK